MTKTLDITTKQIVIINLIFRFRFLDRLQIQKFLNHKDEARTNGWLKNLTEKEYLGRNLKYNHSSSTNLSIYHLAKNGIRLLKTQNIENAQTVQKYYRENERSASFIASCLLIADIYLDLITRSTAETSFAMYLKSDYPNHPLKELLTDLKPSAYIEQTHENYPKYYLLEVFYNLPPERLRQRIKKYLSFYEGSEWEIETGSSFPTILIICPNNQVLIYLKKYLKAKLRMLDDPDLMIYFSTTDQVKISGITGDIWQSA